MTFLWFPALQLNCVFWRSPPLLLITSLCPVASGCRCLSLRLRILDFRQRGLLGITQLEIMFKFGFFISKFVGSLLIVGLLTCLLFRRTLVMISSSISESEILSLWRFSALSDVTLIRIIFFNESFDVFIWCDSGTLSWLFLKLLVNFL